MPLHLALLLASVPWLGGTETGAAAASPMAAPLSIRCTPTTLETQQKGGWTPPQKVKNPIAEALAKAEPGTTIWLDPGDYPPFTIGFQSHSPANAATSGGQPGLPIVVMGAGPDVRIIGSEGDTIAVDQRVPNGWITFRNLTIVPGQRAGVMFYQRGDGRIHQGYSFEDCHILGAFDFATGQGKRSKWGVWGQNLADFTFAGKNEPARIENISEEHAFYLQNVQGAITIENVHARDLGRTFCQFTARTDGPVGQGDVSVRNCVVEDAGIARADGFKGGSAFTICGRMRGAFVFEGNVYRAGFRAERLGFTTPGKPYGTGAFMAWEEGRAGPTATLVLRDNEFSFAPGCGDRPVVSIGGCTQVLIVGANQFVSGGQQPALVLDPVDRQGNPTSSANGSIYLAPATKLEGELTWLGKEPSAEQLTKLQKAPSEKKTRKPGKDREPPGDGG